MYALTGTRTMANAKPKFREPEPEFVRLNLVELKARRRAENLALANKKARERAEQIEADREHANAAIRRANRALGHCTDISTVFQRIGRAFHLTPTELFSKRRDRTLVLARHACMYWACRMTKLSLPEIGHRMGGLDHTTILHGKRAYVIRRARMGRTLRSVR